VQNNLRSNSNARVWVDKQVTELFAFKDNDGSGSVDFEEFLSGEARNIIADRGALDGSKQSLVDMDLSTAGDGGPNVCSLLNKDQEEHAEILFQSWDADGSGSLELAELIKKDVCKSLSIKGKKPQELKKLFKKVW